LPPDPRHPRRLRLQQAAPTPEAAKEIAGYFGIITDIFLRLIKMIIAPLVFATLVSGLANMGDSRPSAASAPRPSAGSSAPRWCP
jgi:L-cystine uptake protein TcyP (sodium:dicarboxylate symporter family)